jgi:hypothetical protein
VIIHGLAEGRHSACAASVPSCVLLTI